MLFTRFTFTLSVLVLSQSTAWAQSKQAYGSSDNGLYVLGSVGRSSLTSFGQTGWSGNSVKTAFKLGAGYQLHPNFALEASYFSLGKQNFVHSSGAVASIDDSGMDISALGMLPVSTDMSLLGRVGIAYHHYSASASAPGTKLVDSTNDNAGLLGLGVEYRSDARLSIRGEYQYFLGSSQVDIKQSLYTLGLKYRF